MVYKGKNFLFKKSWHFVCLKNDLSNKGSYILKDFIDDSIVVIKGNDGIVRAFINSCRHHGAPVVNKDNGVLKKLVCPYHKWTYDLKGKLIRVTGFKKEDNFCIKKLNSNLIELPCKVRENMVFVCLDLEPSLGIDNFLGNYIEKIAKPHAVSKMKCIHKKRYKIQANWKLYAEVDMETLHTPFVHPDSIGKQEVEEIDSKGQWMGVFYRSKYTAALKPDKKEFALPVNKEAYGEGLEGTHFCIIFPGFFVITSLDCMWWIQKIPVGPTETIIDVGYAFHESIIDTKEFSDKSSNYFDRLDQVIKEDDLIVQYQQKGLNKRSTGRYTDAENNVHKFDKKIIQIVLSKKFANES